MKIRVARTAGFCFGVRKALDLVLDVVRDGRGRAGGREEDARLCTLGPLIHNNQALEALKASGVRPVEGLDEVTGRKVVIRAHGAGPSVRGEIRTRGLEMIDATCPRVVRCQRAVERAASSGRQILIAGDADHAEVAALVDFASRYGEGRSPLPQVVGSVELARSVELAPPVTLVAQTTFGSRTYDKIAEALRGRMPNEDAGALEVVRSLCRSTEERQRETEELAREVNAVVVVGGRNSANTRRLAEVAAHSGRPVFHVETADELDPAEFDGLSTVGVTAGASTPAWVTESVVERLVEMGTPVRRSLRGVGKVLLGSNLLLAAGAASVTYAATAMLGFAPGLGQAAVRLFLAFTYVFFAYAEGRAREERRAGLVPILPAHSPAHIRFFDRHTGAILGTAWALAASALALAFWTGASTGLAFLAAVLFAALYSVRILPAGLLGRGMARLRDIPGSKDFFVALAFAFVAVALPHLVRVGGPADVSVQEAPPGAVTRWPEVVVAATSVFLLAFSAATGLELGDVHSDRLVGRESVAVLLGYRRARVLVAGAAAFVLSAMVLVPALGWLSPAAYGLAAASGGVLLAMTKRRTPGDALPQAFAIQFSLLAAGPVAWLVTRLLAG